MIAGRTNLSLPTCIPSLRRHVIFDNFRLWALCPLGSLRHAVSCSLCRRGIRAFEFLLTLASLLVNTLVNEVLKHAIIEQDLDLARRPQNRMRSNDHVRRANGDDGKRHRRNKNIECARLQRKRKCTWNNVKRVLH